jgi:hypothetical protein
MPADTNVAHFVAEAEKRVDTIAILLSIANGQIDAERRQLQGIRQALASRASGREDSSPVSPGAIGPEMLA